MVELICIFRKLKYLEEEGLLSTFKMCGNSAKELLLEKCVLFKASTSHVHECQQNMA